MFLWSLRHDHDALGDGRYAGCREILGIRPDGAKRRLRIVFREGPGRIVPDGLIPSGRVGTAPDRTLNLHLPGTVRALLESVSARGGLIDGAEEFDGWSVFDEVFALRGRPA
ncbi:hypothetical protein BAY61_22405 [Prauserella marina]|nr:hypothetical protein BAY61_22405 [Prauserella marina]